MKCFCTGGLLFLLLLFSVHSQQGGGAPALPGRADIIVLLDNSGTMFPFFDTINTAVLEDITANFIRQGDTFHLITFNTTPAAEIVQQISSERDVRRIVSRFRLLYPLGVYSDFLSAIKFTQRYVNSLTTDTQKIVVIISDGILHPPETSPYYRLSPEETETEIVSSVSRMHRDGTQIYFIKAPFPEGVKIRRLGTGDVPAPSSPDTPAGTEILPPAIPAPAAAPEATGSEAVQDEDDRAPDFFEYATTLEQSPAVVTDMLPDDGEEVPSFTENTLLLPEITFSEVLGKQFYTFRLPLGMINNTDRKLRFQLNGIIINSENVLEKTLFIDVPPRGTASFKPTVVIPDSWESGEQLLSAELVFADNVRVQPQQLHFSVTLTPGGGFAEWFRQSRFIFFALVMIAAAVLLISIVAVLLNRMLSGSHAHAIRAAHDALQETEKAAAAISGSFDSGQVLAGFREKARH